MNKDNNFMPSALDRQISTPDKDAFGHRHFAHALRSLIESEEHNPPFSIGLLGGWGTGKSTIKELYIQDLRDDARKNNNGHTRSSCITSITFNAWRFGGKDQDIKRALLRHVFIELGGDEESLQDRLFRQFSETLEKDKGWWEYTWELLKVWAMPIPAFILTLLLLLGLLFLTMRLLPLEDDLSRSIIGIALIVAYSYILKQVKSPQVAAHRPVTRITLPSTTAEQYEDLLLNQIAKFKAGKSVTPSGKKGNTCQRIVVFIDDLDRLSAEEMVSGLDSVRTFMEIPEMRLPKDLGIVFVISCDEAKVADALSRGRRQGDLPGTVFNQSDARRYLDRIFQFRLEIPPFPRDDMRQYAIRQLNSLPGIKKDFEERGVPIETVVDRMIHIGVKDPRNALQIVNAFAQAWWLAKKRETEGLGTERPGGLHEGAVTKHPVSLGAVSTIKVDFPDFYRDLQNDPTFLHRLTDVIIRQKPLNEQPLPTQELIKEKYLKKQDANTGAPIEVKPECRSLRQFLNSLIGLRWPASLQSLLLLSEDPITRKFGEKNSIIYEAFVSGDTQGVLEGLGRHIDTASLKPDEAQRLYQMAEGLRHESATRRINASRVIADLVERIPENTAHLLLGSLCRELDDSVELRSQLGLQKITKILAAAHGDDRRAIASRLVEDVLTIDEDVQFRLETMEPPSLEEAIEFARATVSLVLPIRFEYELDPKSDTQLFDWLVDRTIKIGNNHSQIPFKELEQWMEDHEDQLLLELNRRYTDLLAAELEAEMEPEFDILKAVERARKIFNSLWSSGEDTRQDICSDLIRYVAIDFPEASKVAWEVMGDRFTATSPNADQISEFIDAFISRLSQDTEEEEGRLDFYSGTQALLTLIRTRLSDLSHTTLSSLSDLAILWSKKDDTASLSCDIVKELQSSESEEVQSVFENWAQRILDDLPLDCINLFGSLFSDFPNSLQSRISSHFKSIISSDNIDEDTGKHYQTFVKAVPSDMWSIDPLNGHLKQLLPQIAARHNNPNNYLFHIFPAIVNILKYAPKDTLGQALHQLFTNAKGHPKHYAWLHSWMAGHWPEPADDLNPYNPKQIFEDGCAFALNHPQSSSNGLLRSLQSMINLEIVPEDLSEALIKAAVATWTVAPDEAIDTFKSTFNSLTPEQAAKLINGIDWENSEHQTLLSQAWSSIIQTMDLEELIQTTNHLLKMGLNGSEEEPDYALRLWIDVQTDNLSDILKNTLIQTNLDDNHRHRIWRQTIRVANNLNSDFFLDVIPKIIVLPEIDETTSTLFADRDQITRILGSSDNQADLSQRLMQAFPEVPTNTVKSKIAEWCKKLSGNASLRQLNYENLTGDDMNILNTYFPGASDLKKLNRKMKSQSKS